LGSNQLFSVIVDPALDDENGDAAFVDVIGVLPAILRGSMPWKRHDAR